MQGLLALLQVEVAPGEISQTEAWRISQVSALKFDQTVVAVAGLAVVNAGGVVVALEAI